MKQYIDKSALVAEIERRIDEVNQIDKASYEVGLFDAYKIILSFLDTLEAKEIGVDLGDPQGDIGVKWVQEEPVSNDLEAEFVLYLKHKFNIPQEGHKLKTNGWRPSPYDILDIAKHFAQWQKKQEVKKVDLEKEIHNAADQYDINNNGNIYWEDIVGFAKHFFELGLKAQKGG